MGQKLGSNNKYALLSTNQLVDGCWLHGGNDSGCLVAMTVAAIID